MTFKLNASHVLAYASASDLTRCGPNIAISKEAFTRVTYALLDGKARQFEQNYLKILYIILFLTFHALVDALLSDIRCRLLGFSLFLPGHVDHRR